MSEIGRKLTPNFFLKNCFRNTCLHGAWKSVKSTTIPFCLSELWRHSRASLLKFLFVPDWLEEKQQVCSDRLKVKAHCTVFNNQEASDHQLKGALYYEAISLIRLVWKERTKTVLLSYMYFLQGEMWKTVQVKVLLMSIFHKKLRCATRYGSIYTKHRATFKVYTPYRYSLFRFVMLKL